MLQRLEWFSMFATLRPVADLKKKLFFLFRLKKDLLNAASKDYAAASWHQLSCYSD